MSTPAPSGWQLRTVAVALLLVIPAAAGAQDPAARCNQRIRANVVAFDQVFFWNRLGAVQPQGMMFALRHDVIPNDPASIGLQPGKVQLRPDKRPRPLVLRMSVGDCLLIELQNLLSPSKVDQEQPATRHVSIHAVGMQLVQSIADDGSFVGTNASSLADVGDTRSYILYAEREGEHLLYSAGTTTGGQGDGGQLNSGLFGAILVEPKGARWYRSQVTNEDLSLATTPQGTLDYEAVYPPGHPRAGLPILNMLSSGSETIHSDLTAIVTGPQANAAGEKGWFGPGDFPANEYTLPERHQPFREFAVIYHDEIGAVQAFPQFEQGVWAHTLHSGRDGFAINYGSAGMGAEVFANRLGVGPMHDCVDCKFEEFFLSAWAVGDPAMIVDVPANAPCMVATGSPNTVTNGTAGFQAQVDHLRDPDTSPPPCSPTAGPKASKAFFPDDPSNVYHGYLGDHTRFRVLHAGSKEHHIHHLHAHQWLYTADSDKSTYLDSQAIGPGASFTAEIAYHGGGNLNRTVGDSIFHCHFYPHFAQGMWALWRVHDVLETGTKLDSDGRPAPGSRALPDGEIAAGTPIPAVVPLPGKATPPQPGPVSIAGGQVVLPAGGAYPGYPFFIPGIAGHRPPSPPLDTIDDGGLPRHVVRDGTATATTTPLDFRKVSNTLEVDWLPDTGTDSEKQAMDFHAQSEVITKTPGGLDAKFPLNGRKPVMGAPFADPCPEKARPITYKSANIQLDVKLNKKGWHFGQQRISSLWEDVGDFLNQSKAPEPLFFRANSNDCIEFWLTNLVPHEYEQDDFQVRTPTDILGQHIHLVKFDVQASDGAANGFNYEDGSLSPGEVRERIDAIRAANGCPPGYFAPVNCPLPESHPFFGPGPNNEWLGAQTTVQRWYADPILDNKKNDRTLRTVFTHDHFGPSTHQQAGLYAGLVVEEADSKWYHNETGAPLGTRHDGGPTSWQAVIEGKEVFREFVLGVADYQLAYWDGRPVNPPGRREVDLSVSNDLVEPHCPNGSPCPELVSAADVGTMAINYRNEPLALRVRDPATNGQAAGLPGDLSYAFSSDVTRADTDLNAQETVGPFYPPLTEAHKGNRLDPYTPTLRVYENDRVQVRVLLGAHEEGHNFSVHGIKWLFEPSEESSGYRGSQMMGISEHYEFIVPQLLLSEGDPKTVDRLYSAGSATDDYWNGVWGLLRAYTGTRTDLVPLSSNPAGKAPDPTFPATGYGCPPGVGVRTFDVVAVTARDALSLGRLTYNSRVDGPIGQLFDPTAILYFRAEDLDASFRIKPNAPVEPLILRARAGECIRLRLLNAVSRLLELDGWNTLPMIVNGFNANDIAPSPHVGLHPQLLSYDALYHEGANIGLNNSVTGTVQTVAPGDSTHYDWYAGDIQVLPDGSWVPTPIEYGAVNLISSDPMEHASKGAIGALIIEPRDAQWTEECQYDSFGNPQPGCTHAAAAVYNPVAYPNQDAQFREFVTIFQNDVNLRTDETLDDGSVSEYGAPVKNLAGEDDAEDTGGKAINYRTEPLWKRMQHAPDTGFDQTRDFQWWDVLSNAKVGGTDPQTPVFHARAGDPIRFRVLMPGGHARNIVFALHGHQWDKEPSFLDSILIGRNSFSFWEGARTGHGPSNHFDAVIRNGAGGKFSIVGDYLYRDQASFGFDSGLWGILRVE